MFLITQQGQIALLSYALNKSVPSDLILHLYTNDKVPSLTDTLDDYVEMTDYTPKTLTGSSWSVGLNLVDVVTGSFAVQIFSFSSGVTAYGYYITDNAGTTLILAERFTNGSFILPFDGGNIKITPNVSFRSCT